MKQAIIIHGMPSRAEYYNPNSEAQSTKHWLPWLQRQLRLRDIVTQTPEMPLAYEPDYRLWCAVFEQFIVDRDTALIGHSCGGGFLLRWLSENPANVGKVALVAPWVDPQSKLPSKMLNFQYDHRLVERTDGVSMFVSLDDNMDILRSKDEILRNVANVALTTFNNYGHFVYNDMKSRAFPELLEELLKSK